MEKAREFASKLKLTYPVAFGLNATDFSTRTGAFYESEKGYLHAAAFLLKPDGTVSNAVYSTGSVGRLTATDALRLIDYFTK